MSIHVTPPTWHDSRATKHGQGLKRPDLKSPVSQAAGYRAYKIRKIEINLEVE